MSASPVDKTDYRFMLASELDGRRIKNPAYSLRAFARALELSAPYLSQVLSGKRTFSPETGAKIARKLKWNAKKRGLFLKQIEYDRAPDDESKALLLDEIDGLSELDWLELQQDQFRLVADWYHFAIVELAAVKGQGSDPAWIAARLGITRQQAQDALERLFRVGLLKDQGGKLAKSSPHYRIKDTPSEAIRGFHQNCLKAAAERL